MQHILLFAKLERWNFKLTLYIDMKKLTTIALMIIISFCAFNQETKTIPIKKYLEFARVSADWTWEHQDSLIAIWRNTLDPNNVFG